MVTPVERRNFVSVVRAAKKSKLGPIFFQNIRVIYKLSMKKQKTGQKTEKKPPKKVFFPAPPTSWLSLAGYGQTISCIMQDMVRPYPAWGGIWSDHIQPCWIWSRPYQAWLEMAQVKLICFFRVGATMMCNVIIIIDARLTRIKFSQLSEVQSRKLKKGKPSEFHCESTQHLSQQLDWL